VTRLAFHEQQPAVLPAQHPLAPKVEHRLLVVVWMEQCPLALELLLEAPLV
jgi:hypothetical protein